MNEIQLKLCDIQGRLFELSVDRQLGSASFIKTFMNSETAKALDNEEAADFMLSGSVKTQVQKEGKKSVRTYFVYVTLTNIETNRIIWQGENDEIKKVIKN